MGQTSHPYGVLRRLVYLCALIWLGFSLPALAADRLILAFGDSLTAGHGLKPGQGFAPQLEQALRKRGYAVRVHNGGVSGDTTSAGRARLSWVLAGLGAKPALVILELGANDMLRGQDPALARANLEAMIATLHQRKIKVLLAGMMAAPNIGPDYAKKFNAIYPDLSKRHGLRLMPFFMKGVAGNRTLLLPDGMHPTPQGVAVIVGNILPDVIATLGKAQ